MADSPNSAEISMFATDIVFSCAICQATLSNLHAEDGGNSGLRMSDTPENSKISRLWLTECAHLSCGKHFLDGGLRAPHHLY